MHINSLPNSLTESGTVKRARPIDGIADLSRQETFWRLFTWVWRLICLGVVLSAISTPSKSQTMSGSIKAARVAAVTAR